MRYKTGLILVSLMVSFTGLRFSLARQSHQCLAVITEIKGDVRIKEVDMIGFTRAIWGTQLFQGDQISTSDKSEVKLLFSNNSFIILGANSMLTISGKELPLTESMGDVKKLSSAMMVNISAFTSKRENSKDVGALAGVRSVTFGQAIELELPYNTLIKTTHPSFSWISKQTFDNYIVNLYNSKGLVWSKKVSELMMRYPENEKELEFGESYIWNVEGHNLTDTDKSGSQKFTVLTLEKSKEVEDYVSVIRNTFKDNPGSSSLHSVLGAYFINHGLLQDAISEFHVVSKINTDAVLPHEILGSLYTDVGEKDKAIEELQKALILSDKDK